MTTACSWLQMALCSPLWTRENWTGTCGEDLAVSSHVIDHFCVDMPLVWQLAREQYINLVLVQGEKIYSNSAIYPWS